MKLAQQILEAIVDLGGLGLTRDEMPQIDGAHIEEFLDYVLHDCERDYEHIYLPVSALKPSQNELDTDKADDIWANGKATEHPIIVSGDRYVLDGHHRWLAVKRNDPDAKIKCIMLSDNAEPALDMMHDFDKAKKRDINDEEVK